MLAPRRFDEAGLRAYVDDVRPRFVVLRVRANNVNIIWGLPLWAAEEVVAFALGAAWLLKVGMPLLPAAVRGKLGAGITLAGREYRLTPADEMQPESGAVLELYRTVNELAGGVLRSVLRVPPGQPYVQVSAGDTHVEIAAY